jgi:hypothetical protein
MRQARSKKEFLKIVALGKSKQHDVSDNHDKYIAATLYADYKSSQASRAKISKKALQSR